MGPWEICLRIESNARAQDQELALGAFLLLQADMSVFLSHEGSLERFQQKLQAFVVRKRAKNGAGGGGAQCLNSLVSAQLPLI